MRILAIVSLMVLIVQFVLAILSAILDQEKVPVVSWFPTKKTIGTNVIEESGRSIVTAEFRSMTEIEKRKRFIWFALSAFPAMLFILVYLIKELI